MGPLDGVTHSWGNWGKDRSAHWLAHPVPWDFTRVELVGSWESLRGSLGGVSMSMRAGPFAGGAGLGHPEFHSSQTQVSQHRPEPRGASRRNWAGLEGRKLGRKGLHVSACRTVSAELGVFYHHQSRQLSTALPIRGNTSVCGFEQEQRLGVSGLCLYGRTGVCLPCLLSIIYNKLHVFGVGESSPQQSCAVWPPHTPEPTGSPPGGCPPYTIPVFCC